MACHGRAKRWGSVLRDAAWTQQDLAEHSGVSAGSTKRLEVGEGPLAIRLDTLETLRTALEAAGVVFIPANGGGPGIRTREYGWAPRAALRPTFSTGRLLVPPFCTSSVRLGLKGYPETSDGFAISG